MAAGFRPASTDRDLPFLMMVVQFVVVAYPETKGVTLEGMEKQLAIGH